MKLKFNSTLEYQREAISAVVNLFEGQPIVQSSFEISASASEAVKLSDRGVGNNIILDDQQLLSNVHKVQEANDIEKVSSLQGREFSIEMETGTGKTYVYLRSIFELSEHYGLKKFIIVVPSIAIREGVLKSIDIMKEHFRTLYNNVPFKYFVYDSKKLDLVHRFATRNEIQIMVINIQSFQKDITGKETNEMADDELKKLNIINRENDKMSGHKPIEFIQATNPIVIIDEPQSVDNTPKAKRAIANLNPAITLRYSATHREFYNLLYKLDPIQAYDLRLVKRVEVASLISDESFNDAYVKLLQTDNKQGIRAQVEIHRERSGRVKLVKLWVKQNDDLYTKSGERQSYKDGYIVHNIDCTPGAQHIEFNNGQFLGLGGEMGGLRDDIMKAQVYKTIEQHLSKERALKNKAIKVLSLFFIDKVANYRTYNNDGSIVLGKIGRWFEEAYEELTAKAIHREFAVSDISKIHDGYFSKDKRGRAKDTRGQSFDDEDTYNLIMREKERLLDPKVPLRFIFSHSALREGWDNPNVFQICTLNETQSKEKKRQEIGRGLRLPVNEQGERIYDEIINRLTILANESYEDFAKSLQKELEEDYGLRFGRIEKIAFAKIIREKDDGVEEAIGQEVSKHIWEELKNAGYIDETGNILDAFDPKKDNFRLEIRESYDDIKADIIDKIRSFVFKDRIVNAGDRHTLKFKKEVHLSDDFRVLWEKIKHRTRYRVQFDTAELVEEAKRRIKSLEEIKLTRIAMTRAELDIAKAGVSFENKLESKSYETSGVKVLPDILAYLQRETGLTRHTLAEILQGSGRVAEFKNNPQKFMTLVAREITRALNDLMLVGIQYEKIANHYWEMNRIKREAEEGIVRYLKNLYMTKNQEKCLFDAVEYDSEVEKQFAQDLDNNDYVRLFVKLPDWFKIDTPIGPYNPDWAFVTQRDEKLYFVRETKSTLDYEEYRKREKQKILCGQRHFDTIGVNYGVATKVADVDF